MRPVDVAIVGGGIVGVATAHRLVRQRPGTRVVVLDKEAGLARHQTGHASGVVHSGIAYRPGSLKARLCVAGRAALERLCEEHGLPYRRTGKLLLATTPEEAARLEVLHRQGRANGVHAVPLDATAVRRREPHAHGLAGLWVPETGVTSFPAVVGLLARQFRERGGEIRTGTTVQGLAVRAGRVRLDLGDEVIEASSAVVAAGLQGDRLARSAGLDPGCRILPFRGEYWQVRPERADLCRALIYPVPDPALPFLGVHWTRHVDDTVTVGPNAVLATAREGYSRGDVDLGDLAETLRWPGTWALLRRHGRAAWDEARRSWSRERFAEAARRLVPDLQDDDLVPAPAGVRAQAVDRQGTLVDDFRVVREGPVVAVVNAPSPAATSAIALAEVVLRTITP